MALLLPHAGAVLGDGTPAVVRAPALGCRVWGTWQSTLSPSSAKRATGCAASTHTSRVPVEIRVCIANLRIKATASPAKGGSNSAAEVAQHCSFA